MRLASCLVASVLMAVVWHASPVNGENYLRAAGTDTVSGAGRSDNELPTYTSKSGIANRVSPEAKVHVYKSWLIESPFSITAIIVQLVSHLLSFFLPVQALRMLSALHGHRDSLKFWPPVSTIHGLLVCSMAIKPCVCYCLFLSVSLFPQLTSSPLFVTTWYSF